MIKTIVTIVRTKLSHTGKNITCLLPLALLLVLHTRNNTDGNKLVVCSGIALYYGGNHFSGIQIQRLSKVSRCLVNSVGFP